MEDIMKFAKSMVILALAGAVAVPTFGADKKAPATKTAPAAKAPAAKAPAAKPAEDIWASLPAVVAKINGVPLTKADVISFFKSQFPNGQLPPFFNAAMVKQLAPRLIKSIVSQKLMDAEMAKAGFKAGPEQVKKIPGSRDQKSSERAARHAQPAACNAGKNAGSVHRRDCCQSDGTEADRHGSVRQADLPEKC
jgi:hypothetical protein